jgi:uncharacterized protein
VRRKERQTTDITEIESIILKADVCRIALADGGVPYIVTMNFGYSASPRKSLYFHCATGGRKLEMIRKNNRACFEVDTDHKVVEGVRACDFSMNYRSVVGWGSIAVINESDEKIAGLGIIMHHYTGKTGFNFDPGNLARLVVLRLDIEEMTGKKHISGT